MTGADQDTSYYLGQHDDAFVRYQLFNRAYQPGTEQVFSWLQLPSNSQVLELGCGIGATACYMAREIVPDGHVTAFDVAEELVDCGRRTAADLGISNITFVHASAQDFQYQPDTYDLVHTRFVISYLPDAAEIVRAVYTALKPLGRFFSEEITQVYITDGDTQWYDSMKQWFAKLIEAGGGNPEYGSAQLATDLHQAGFAIENASAFWPVQEQALIKRMLAIALSNEMKQNLASLNLATEEEVDKVVAHLEADQESSFISPTMAAQLVGRKPVSV